jgi:hypothetical protein
MRGRGVEVSKTLCSVKLLSKTELAIHGSISYRRCVLETCSILQ